MPSALTPEEARKFYDRFGARQDKQGFYEDAATADLIANADFGEAKSVFEFGCGTGRFAAKIMEQLPAKGRYRGVDISPKMVELATEKLKPWQGRVEVELYDGSSPLPAGDGSVDRFVSTFVFDLLSEEEAGRIVSEARRVLSAQGRLCLVSLTFGERRLSRLVSWGWQRVYALRPQLVGGCRPVRLISYLPAGLWKIEYRKVVTAAAIASEVVVARPLDTSQA
jgi:ubiquinone/menaquinone biosynthesis C-methylase UbiE